MKLGSSRRRESQRRRQRFWFGLIKWSLLLGAVVLAGGYAWYTGSNVARREVDQLQAENSVLKGQVDSIQSQFSQSSARVTQLEQQTPPENLRKVVELLKSKVAAGVPVDRLEFIIGAAKAQRSCDPAPIARRFFVQTPVYATSSASASFGDNAITVTAEGASTLNPEGKLQAWFDPAQPVTVNFAEIGGSVSKATGILPLQHTVVSGQWEYKFNITAAARGILNVTAERCHYP